MVVYRRIIKSGRSGVGCTWPKSLAVHKGMEPGKYLAIEPEALRVVSEEEEKALREAGKLGRERSEANS